MKEKEKKIIKRKEKEMLILFLLFIVTSHFDKEIGILIGALSLIYILFKAANPYKWIKSNKQIEGYVNQRYEHFVAKRFYPNRNMYLCKGRDGHLYEVKYHGDIELWKGVKC